MLEIPEAAVIAKQINRIALGKRIAGVTANQTPHKLVWYNGDPQEYQGILNGKSFEQATSRGGMVEVRMGDTVLLFSDGINLRYHGKDESRPSRHQLLIEFADSTALSASVQMYGGVVCFQDTYDNSYYRAALEKPSPLSSGFNT
jgi:formamidopyrimidine-DNA glycosylase